MASKFSEISAALDKNIGEVESKKKSMDSAQAALAKASEGYQKAIEEGQTLKRDLLNCLNESYPPSELKSKIG